MDTTDNGKTERVTDEDDPRRCMSQRRDTDQCMNIKVEGSDYCTVHGGNQAAVTGKAKSLQQYQLTQFRSRVSDFATNPKIKDLREEIGITRMILESIINQCKDETDLLVNSSKIAAMVNNISVLVQAAHKLESSMGQMLDKMAAIQLSGEIVKVITDSLMQAVITVVAILPEEYHEEITKILETDLVDQIMNGMLEPLERIGKEHASTL